MTMIKTNFNLTAKLANLVKLPPRTTFNVYPVVPQAQSRMESAYALTEASTFPIRIRTVLKGLQSNVSLAPMDLTKTANSLNGSVFRALTLGKSTIIN